MASYIGHLANSFYAKPKAPRGSTFKPYLAPQSSAFGGTLGSRPGAAPSTPAPAGATASGTASAGSAPTAGSGLPPDPAYEAAIGAYSQQLDNNLGSLTQQRTTGLSGYGYTEDPTTHAVAYDPNNPYSQASLLRLHYQQAKARNTTSYAASGQLYAGSLQNAQNASTSQFQQSDSALTSAVQAFLANNTMAQTQAGNTYDLNAAGALGQSVDRANAAGDSANIVTAGPGGQALVPQVKNSNVKLAPGWSAIYDNKGNVVRLIPPGG